MSRVAKNPIVITDGVEITVSEGALKVKGPKGSSEIMLSPSIKVNKEQKQVTFAPITDDYAADAIAGTTRALVAKMVEGVTKGFEKKLVLIGVGFKAQAQGKALQLAIGFSHPIRYSIPEGIKIETPSQTEILIKGIDRQLVGQVAADIRAFRPPEPYKGKGIRYEKEVVVQKEGKKK